MAMPQDIWICCKANFTSHELLENHLEDNHLKQLGPNDFQLRFTSSEPKHQIQCSKCNHTFRNLRAFWKHTKCNKEEEEELVQNPNQRRKGVKPHRRILHFSYLLTREASIFRKGLRYHCINETK